MSEPAEWEVKVAGIDDLQAKLGVDFLRLAPEIVTWMRGWAQRLEDENRYPSGNTDWETGYTVSEIERTADLLDQAIRNAPCHHRNLVDITTYSDTARRVRVYLCNDCSKSLEEKA